MKYTSVEVLKPIPGFEAGIIPLIPHPVSPESEDSKFIRSEERLTISYHVFDMKPYPDFFRLISEPSFEVGQIVLWHSEFCPIVDVEGDVIVIQRSKGVERIYASSISRLATEEESAEYLAQEESKKPWRPKLGEPQWWVTGSGLVYGGVFDGPDKHTEAGNCFRTKEAAEYFRDNYLNPAFEKYAQDYATLPAEVK